MEKRKVGRPRHQIVCNQTGEVFDGLVEAAKYAGVSDTTMSRHLKGMQHIRAGISFRRLEKEGDDE